MEKKKSSATKPQNLRVAFLHPDLGLGGAERLIVDAAHGLAQRGHKVSVFTSHFEPERTFAETQDGSFPVVVHGDWLPRHLFGRFHILFATLRSIWLALAVALFAEQYDVYVCDQISTYIPLLRMLRPKSKVLFYCHFPDQLLSIRRSWLKRTYRIPFDMLEEFCTGMAHLIVVNSGFTKSTFRQTFRRLQLVDPAILYPCIHVDHNYKPEIPQQHPIILLSINRYERKKNVELAISALARLQFLVDEATFNNVHLIVAGGYDSRVPENVGYYDELAGHATKLGLLGEETGPDLSQVLPNFPKGKEASVLGYEQIESGRHISFVRSFTDEQKAVLLQKCSAVIYTPSNEHFGIVPLEAMAASRPVIAVNNGGPLESIVDGHTGFLRPAQAQEFANALSEVLQPGAVSRLGQKGRNHILAKFSREAFTQQLEDMCRNLCTRKGN